MFIQSCIVSQCSRKRVQQLQKRKKSCFLDLKKKR